MNNALAILDLIAGLYSQVQALQQRIAELERALQDESTD